MTPADEKRVAKLLKALLRAKTSREMDRARRILTQPEDEVEEEACDRYQAILMEEYRAYKQAHPTSDVRRAPSGRTYTLSINGYLKYCE